MAGSLVGKHGCTSPEDMQEPIIVQVGRSGSKREVGAGGE